MKQTIFENYLQYLEWDPKKFAEARKDGKLDTRTQQKQEHTPEWLIRDAGIWDDEIEEFKINGAKKIINRLIADGVKENSQPELTRHTRVLCTPKGYICWCLGDDLIHQNLMAFAMFKGKVPKIKDKFGDGHWAWNYQGYKTTICLEYNTYEHRHGKGMWFLAESYDYDVSSSTIQKIQNETLYDSVFKTIGIDKSKLESLL